MSQLAPLDLKQMGPNLLGVVWNDGHHSLYQVRHLRLQCPCAHCVDEWTREKLLNDDSVPSDIRPKRIEPVGRYAFKITWSDGHDSGFFTFDKMRRLCECPACKAA